MEYIQKSKKLADSFDHLFFDIVNDSPLSIVIADRHRKIVYVNQFFCSLTGYDYEEVIGKNPSILKSGLTPMHVYQDMYATLEKVGKWQGEFKNRKKNGSLYIEYASISMIYDKKKIPYFIAFKQDVTEMVELNENVYTDSTTSLFNRRYLNEQLPIEIQSSVEAKTPLSIIFIDLDFFKKINDRYGHIIGDELIKMVALFLLDNFKQKFSWIARYGGDEFLVCLPKTGKEQAYFIANQVRALIEQKIFKIQEKELSITCSFGVEEISEQNSIRTAEKLLSIVDKKLYLAKFDGKNTGFV